MAVKITGTTVINDSRNIENITTINGTAWATVVSNALEGTEVDLNELTDVTIGTLATGQVVQYNGTSWVNTGLDFTDIASTIADAQVPASAVTQHQAALSITESQISDLTSYEPADATILKDADIGSTVQAFDANYVVDATYVKTDENFTTADHSKLDGIEANATADQTGAEIKALYEAEANAYTDALNTKLAGIETGATADQTGAEIKALYEAEADAFVAADRTKLDFIEAAADVTDSVNVTAAGALMDSEVTNLAAVKSFDPADYQAAGSYEPADSTILKDADIGVNVQAFNANYVVDATYVKTDENFTTADHSKLDGIEAAATADQTGAEIKALYEAETNAYTDALNTKLSGIETAATADQTGAEIKSLYEGQSDTNAYDDAAVAKLAGIEANATADQTAGEIRALVASATDSQVFTDADHTKLNGIEALADVTDTDNVVAALSAGTGVSISAGGEVAVTAVALTTVQTAASQSAQLALTAQEGDIVVRSDENKSYVHNGGSAGTMGDYTLLATPTDGVLSVNGATGAVVLSNATTGADGLMSSSDKTKLNGIEALADVTDTANVTAAGALMDSEITHLNEVKAFDPNNYATSAQGSKADSALQSVAFSDLTSTPTTVAGYGITDISTDLVSDTSPQLGGALQFNGNNIQANDSTSSVNNRIQLGTSQDLQLYHNGNASYIEHANTSGSGHLYIQNNTVNSDVILRANRSNSQTPFFRADSSNGAARIYHDGSERLASSSSGVTVTGTLAATAITGDGSGLTGLSSDLVNDSSPQLGGNLDTNGHDITASADFTLDTTGSITLDSSTGTAYFAQSGTNFLHLFKSGSATGFRHPRTAGGTFEFQGYFNSSVIGALKLDMTDNGTATFNHDVKLKDSSELVLGTDSDMKIMHDGTDFLAESTVGDIKIRASGDNKGIYLQHRDITNSTYVDAFSSSGFNGRAYVNYNGSYRFISNSFGSQQDGDMDRRQGVVYASSTRVDSATVATTTATEVFSVPFQNDSLNRNVLSFEAVIQVKDTVNEANQISKVLVVTDGSDAYISSYGETTTTGSALAGFTADLSGNNMRLLSTCNSSNSTLIKVHATCMYDLMP